MRNFIVGLAIVIAAAGCSHRKALTFHPEAQPGQMQMYEQGLAKLGSNGDESIVIIKPADDKVQGNRAKFILAFTNKGERPFDVSTTSVTATDHLGTALKVYSYEELTAEQEKRRRNAQGWAIASMVLAGTSGMAAAHGGSNMASLYQTQAQASQLATISQQGVSAADATLKQYEETVLRRNTLLAGATMGGFVYVDARQGGTYTLRVAAGSDQHVFKFVAR